VALQEVMVAYTFVLCQIVAGKVDHDVLYGLDFVLDEARLHGFKVIISLVDNWKYHGGVDEFVDWSRSAPKRKQKRPADQAGDFDDQARPAF
jgi:mannan endo-1,4-beta-mannosidase